LVGERPVGVVASRLSAIRETISAWAKGLFGAYWYFVAVYGLGYDTTIRACCTYLFDYCSAKHGIVRLAINFIEEHRDMNMPEWGTLVAAVFGGGALMRLLEYIVGRLFDRFRDEEDAETKFRDELRDTINALKADVRVLQEEARQWREKFYEQQESNVQLRLDLSLTQRELHQTQSKLKDVEAQLEVYKNIVNAQRK
jgi:hypothetical protein